MSSTKKNSFLFDSDDSDQQILPFDFLDEDEEETIKPEEVKKTTAIKEDDSKPETEIPSEEKAETPTATIPEPRAAAEEIEKFGPSADKKSEDHEKTEAKIAESESSIKNDRKEPESTTKEIIPETVKIPAPEKSKPVISPKKDNKQAPVISSASGLKPGQILQEARVRKDLSLDQVALSTKIKKSYIEALENGDDTNLPASVFVEAYIKTLCSVYEIDHHQVRQGIVRQKPGKVVPGELLHHIEEGKQVNFEEEAKINKFFKIAAIIITLLGLAVYSGIKLTGPEKNDQATSTDQPEVAKPETPEKIEPKITSKDLEIFLYQQPFTMTEMKLPEKGMEESSDNI